MASHQSCVYEFNKPENELNILLLGETGVGKTTFINAFVNYLTYTTLEEAQKEKPICLIPTFFTIEDKDGNEHEVKLVDEGKNELNIVGESSTQATKTYDFLLPDDSDDSANTLVRFIDTPGVGDTRGIEHDKKNFEDILKFIDMFKSLHAICILSKPNQARLTAQFEFCIKQLLSQLEKSACKNIVFVFTHARGEDYTPGQTKKPLEKLLQRVKENQPDVEIILNKSNMYCMDNEPFRFLVARDHKFTYRNKRNFRESWEISRKEYLRMLKYIVGLEPHNVSDTISLNKARRTLDKLLEPLAEIVVNIGDNLSKLNKHKEEIKMYSNDINGLEKRLFIPKVVLETIKIDSNRLICTSEKCRRTYDVGDNLKFYYPQKCCEDCIVDGHYTCSAFILSAVGTYLTFGLKGVFCSACQCAKLNHKTVRSEERVKEDKGIDEDVKDQIAKKQTSSLKAEAMIEELEKRCKAFEEESKFITESAVKFDFFVKNNAIVANNDSFKNYLEHCVENEKSLLKHGSKNEEVIKTTQEVLREYEKKEKSLDEIKKTNTCESFVVSSTEIFMILEDLYRLKHYGMKIKESVIEREKFQDTERIRRQTLYVVKKNKNLLTGLFSNEDQLQ